MPRKKATFTCPDCGSPTTEAGLCDACKAIYAAASENEGLGSDTEEGGSEDGNTES